MKVKIMQRSVYHKIAEIEIEIPDDWNVHTEDGMNFIHDYLIDNPQMYEYEMDNAINEAEYDFGFGLDNDKGLDEKDNESEWRYDIVGQNYGGHL